MQSSESGKYTSKYKDYKNAAEIGMYGTCLNSHLYSDVIER